jgi:hypothetical protein
VAVANLCGWLRKLPHEIVEDIKASKANIYKLLDDFTSYLASVRAAPRTMRAHSKAHP